MSETLTKLLYVEDDDSIAQVVVITLEELGGFTVKHCDSGAKAIDSVVAYAPQLILMDVMMPRMSGPETLEQFSQMPAARHIPVIFMTAKAQTHEQEAYRALGAIGVIVKPFDPMTLSDQIVALWQAHRAG